MKRGLCLGVGCNEGEMGGMLFGIHNISRKCMCVISGQADE